MPEEQKQNERKCVPPESSGVSPLKEIILTFLLDKETRSGGGSRWADPKFQLIHVEPLSTNTICAFTMETNKINGKYEVTLDIRFEVENNMVKIEHAILQKSKKDSSYDWDLCVWVGRKGTDDSTSLKLDGSYDLEKDQYIDFHLQESEIDFGVLSSALAMPRRICRIGLH